MSQPTRVAMSSAPPAQLQRRGGVLRIRFALEIEIANQLDHPPRGRAVELELEHGATMPERRARVVAFVERYPGLVARCEIRATRFLVNQLAIDGHAHVLSRDARLERLS